MVAARDADFLNDGTVDPFTGIAPGMTPEEQLAQQRLRLRQTAINTANINNRPGGYTQQRTTENAQNTAGKSVALLEARARAGDPLVTPEVLAAARELEKLNHDAMNGFGYKALTYGVLAAPALVTGAGAAFAPGGLGFSAGSGSIAAADSATAATESAAASAQTPVWAANEAGLAAPGAAGSQAGSTAGGQAALDAAANEAAGVTVDSGGTALAGGSTAAGGTTAAGGSAAGAAPAWLSEGGELGKDLAVAAGPLLINEALGGKTKEEKALIAKQQQLAQEAKVRQGQQQDARMNQLGQQLLAFNPSNQLMAKMYGPDAAFSPEQMANMVKGQKPPDADPSLINYQGVDPKKRAEVAEWIRRQKEYEAAEAARREMMMNGITQPGPGPTPIQMSAPQAARRY